MSNFNHVIRKCRLHLGKKQQETRWRLHDIDHRNLSSRTFFSGTQRENISKMFQMLCSVFSDFFRTFTFTLTTDSHLTLLRLKTLRLSTEKPRVLIKKSSSKNKERVAEVSLPRVLPRVNWTWNARTIC